MAEPERSEPAGGELTRALAEAAAGNPQASENLLPLVYDELRRLAAIQLARESPGHTLQATALVHEAYLRVVSPSGEPAWANRRHFFAAAAEAMRRILVESARRKRRLRHGGDRSRVDLGENDLPIAGPRDDIIELNDAFEQFAVEEPDKAELVKLRFFAGMEEQEAADVLGISRTTAARHWSYARAWLYDRLRDRES
jgi:RNA polymerase sigma factor (TIGR02999 family)